MTESEAIKIIDNAEFLTNRDADYAMSVIEAIEMAKVALEKQIPQSPDYEGDGYSNGQLVYDTWVCPCCGQTYEVDYDDYEYCPKCGQHIDWSDENEEIN